MMIRFVSESPWFAEVTQTSMVWSRDEPGDLPNEDDSIILPGSDMVWTVFRHRKWDLTQASDPCLILELIPGARGFYWQKKEGK
jgi:hypothetical protein